MAERVVRVRLSAQVAEYEAGMLKAAQATRTVGTEAEKLAQRREAFNTIGTAGLAAGTAMLAGSALAAKAAMAWQSAWTGVLKTVDGTPAQLAEVEQGLRDLTGVLPASHEEIAAVAEAAGQLGIETPNVVAFTRTMIDLGESTNLSAEQAATSLARFTNIMGTSQTEVSNLGSALVGLGNNYATTEAEIMEMAMRLAGAGKQIGLSEGQVLGLSTALSSVGIEAEAGGSAMSKVMIDIAAAADQGGDKLDKFAAAAGMSADQFAKMWKSNPAEALSAFVKGLANAESQGQSTLGVLADLGITEVRMRDALLRSSAAADMFTGAMERGSDEFEKNNALAEEAEKRYATAESKIRIAGNAVRDTAIDFGQVLLPAVSGTADAVKGFADFLGDLPDPVKGLIVLGGSLAGVIMLAGGAFLVGVPKVAAFKVAMQELELTGGKLRGGLSRVTSFLGGPWGIAMLAAAAATASFNAAIADGVPTMEEISNAMRTGATEADGLASAFKRSSLESGVWGDYADQLKDLPGLLDHAISAQGNWADALSTTVNQRGAYDSLKRYGEALANLASTDLPAATEQFGALVEQYELTDKQALQLLREMGPFRDVLLSQASSADIAADSTGFLELATGKSAITAKTAADAYLAEAQRVDDLASQMRELVDRINEANGINQTAVSANARYQEALAGISAEVARQRDEFEQLNGTTDGFVASLDENTAAGSANAAMLADLAGSAQEAALKQFEVDKSTMSAKDAADKYLGTLAAQRQAFIDSAVEAGFNAQQVQALADRVFALPDAKEVQVIAETADAQWSIDNFIELNNGKRLWLYAGVDIEDPAGRFENGGIPTYRAFASGGIRSNLQSGFYSGEVHKFAEKSLPWEAYISPKPDQRERNYGVWMEVGSRLGFSQGADQAALVAEIRALRGALGRPNVSIVNPVARDPLADAWEAAQIVGIDV